MATNLDQDQLRNAKIIYSLARARGATDPQALDIVWGAYHESGLRNQADNPSTHAHGLFQLLSQGYRDRAAQLGGLENPRANTLAILPDYLNFFKSHPGAPSGAAAAAVERSGKGADWYRSLGSIPGIGAGGLQGPQQPLGAAAGAGLAGNPSLAPGPDLKQMALDLITQIEQRHGRPGFNLLQQLHDAQREAPQAAPGAQTAPSAAQATRTAGGIMFPVQGGAKFSNDWGSPRGDIPGGQHQGNDLFAPRGTPVVAVEDGTVTKMGPSAIGGNRIWINGKWYYAHLDRFAPGMRPGRQVKAGEVIGFVGNTGDARGTPTHLHFGYDPQGTQGGHWANPYPLLGGH